MSHRLVIPGSHCHPTFFDTFAGVFSSFPVFGTFSPRLDAATWFPACLGEFDLFKLLSRRVLMISDILVVILPLSFDAFPVDSLIGVFIPLILTLLMMTTTAHMQWLQPTTVARQQQRRERTGCTLQYAAAAK